MLDLNKVEPYFLAEFKKKNDPNSYSDDCDNYKLRQDLRNSLLSEQNSQCFYCEKKINNAHDSNKVHLDHIKQRNHYHILECDYNNMVLSCNGDGEKYCGKYKDKQGKWDNVLHISLESEKPSDIFHFVSNGNIKSKKSLDEVLKTKVDNTITYLNLNHSDLIGARKTVYLALDSYENQGIDKAKIFTYFNEFESIFK